MPAGEEHAGARRVERRKVEPPLQVAPEAGVVAREDVGAPEPAQEDVLGRPAADAPQLDQASDRGLVSKAGETLEVEAAGRDKLGCLHYRPRLLRAEPERAQRHRIGAGEVLGPGEGVGAVGLQTVALDDTVEHLDPERQRDLLAGDRVDERLERARIARRTDPAQARRERAEVGVRGGELVERRHVEGQPENADERWPRRFGKRGLRQLTRRLDLEQWRVRAADLSDREGDRRAVGDDHAPVGARVEPVDDVVGPPPERPGREVEAKRRRGLESEAGDGDATRWHLSHSPTLPTRPAAQVLARVLPVDSASPSSTSPKDIGMIADDSHDT